MGKKIILFDIDDTLIDVHPMAKNFYQKIADTIGSSFEKIVDAKEKYKTKLEKYSDYHPNELMEFIYKVFKVDESKKINPFIEGKYYKEALFPEVREVLKKLSKKYRLGIFSEGFEDYQGKKILALVDLLDKELIFILRRKLEKNSLKKLPKGSIVIDDRKEVVEKLRDFGGFKVFWLNRNQDDEKIDGITTIQKLNELVNLLR
ncbi:MAG: HAD family hydrolase [Candidatus Shapirobacteria bacterium]|nr:HAD family hydrolase [Candidatus Shapirobacteria bacterium]